MEHILFVSSRYPNKINPSHHVFLQQLVWSIADLGYRCSVIAPLPINLTPAYKSLPVQDIEETPSGSLIQLYFPRYFSFGQRDMLWINSSILTTNMFTRVVNMQMTKLEQKPKILYGHFLVPAGISIGIIGQKYKIPTFVAYGESTAWSISNYGIKKIPEYIKKLTGVVAVSSANKNRLIDMGICEPTKIQVFPNAVSDLHFYPRNKKLSREKFGFSQNSFIVAFVGQFNHRKGVLRVSSALEDFEGVSIAYAGKGDLIPKNRNTVYCDIVKHEDMPFFLSAADVFLLPTLNEGCCNAIIEAMACGLPIISSNRSFNDDILDSTCSIRIDPESVEEIRTAIEMIYNDLELKESLSKGALIKSKNFTLKERAKRIISFIESKINIYFRHI